MRTHYELPAPLLPMAAAVAGAAMIGVAHYMTVAPPVPEPALQPHPRHADLLFEGVMLGIAVGAVYVVGRAVGEGNRPERRTVDFDTYRDELSRLLDLVDQEKLGRVDRDMLAAGIRVVRGRGGALAEAIPGLTTQHPKAFELGERIVALLASGDRDLEHGEVAELVALLDRRLPPTIP